jgi:hypothetical protein
MMEVKVLSSTKKVKFGEGKNRISFLDENDKEVDFSSIKEHTNLECKPLESPGMNIFVKEGQSYQYKININYKLLFPESSLSEITETAKVEIKNFRLALEKDGWLVTSIEDRYSNLAIAHFKATRTPSYTSRAVLNNVPSYASRTLLVMKSVSIPLMGLNLRSGEDISRNN